jgi:hypothetical protein
MMRMRRRGILEVGEEGFWSRKRWESNDDLADDVSFWPVRNWATRLTSR